ncbi:MAG: serine/threonine protein kinase [Solirubrobacteraceae bacterium]|nr:serine/threonine protein kinase [Solirubrobacteraceae bacterium]
MVQTADPTLATTVPGHGAGPVVLGRYRLVRRLGAGAFGVVWLAHDERLDRAVAVKRIALHDAQIAARAEREALAAARLAHPGIVALHEAGRDAEAVYLVSELVRGHTLAELIEAGALSDRDVLRIGAALCDALEHAHGRGVVHRDVKPANVIVPDAPHGEAGIAKLTDFGVAALAGDGGLTRTGDVVGTLAYMAPEQAEGRPAGGAADLYALALVLYEALSGVNPVRAPGAAATARRVGTRLPPLARMRRDLPRAVCAAIDRAVLPDPEARGTPADLRDALDAVLDVADRTVGPVAPSVLEDAGTLPAAPVAPPSAVPGRLAAAALTGALTALATALLPAGAAPEPGAALIAAAALAGLTLLAPRLGWPVAVAGLGAWLAVHDLGGVALLLVLAAAPVPLLLPRAGVLWPLPALAPLLAVPGLATAWPALAGQPHGAWRRGALGALGLWWVLLAEPLADRALLLGAPAPRAPRAAWEGSVDTAWADVVLPLLSSGAPALALVWGLAAWGLPLLVHGVRAGADLLAAGAWAAGLAAATGAVAASVTGLTAAAAPTGLVAGALAGAALALIAAAVRRRG